MKFGLVNFLSVKYRTQIIYFPPDRSIFPINISLFVGSQDFGNKVSTRAWIAEIQAFFPRAKN